MKPRLVTNAYIYSKMVCPALDSIVLATKWNSSLQDRVAMVLKFAWPMREENVPENLKQYWRNITAVWEKEVPAKAWWMKTANAKARTLKPTEAKRVLKSFLKIADAVIKKQGSSQRSRGGS